MKRDSQIVWRWLGLMAAVTVGMVCVVERKAVGQANVEHQALLKDGEETERLTRENADLEKQRAIYKEVKNLREGRTELARLRGEWERLRTQANEAEKLRAENQQLANAPTGTETNTVPTNFIARSELADMGLASPEAAVQTLFYALTRGDLEHVPQYQEVAARLSPEQRQEQGESLRKEFANFTGFAITEKNMISPNEAEIGVVAITGGAVDKLHLIRAGDQWNVK